MKKCSFLLILCLAFITSWAQQTTSYLNRLSDSTIRVYLDNNYYLTPADCEFKSIERVAGFDFIKHKYEGSFRDFNLNGRVILAGNYSQGKKQGLFTAYHGNGHKKWVVQFENDKPTGDWTYYYPDELPMLIVNYGAEGARITSFWDTKRKQQVIDGKGTYSFTIPFEGFSEYGYPSYNRRGKLSNGLPDGHWPIYFVDAKGRATLAAEEYYKAGSFLGGDDLFEDKNYESTPYRFLPIDNFNRAEEFIAKNCTFDEYTNFNQYLADKIESAVNRYQIKDLKDQSFSYQVFVSERGTPKGLAFMAPLSSSSLQRVIEYQLNRVNYYYPTWKDGAEISDRLLISGDIHINEAGVVKIYNIQIQRNNSN